MNGDIIRSWSTEMSKEDLRWRTVSRGMQGSGRPVHMRRGQHCILHSHQKLTFTITCVGLTPTEMQANVCAAACLMRPHRLVRPIC